VLQRGALRALGQRGPPPQHPYTGLRLKWQETTLPASRY